MILLKQDAISLLEEELHQIDSMEESELVLGCARRDRNPQRKNVMKKLDNAFSEYGK
jgi:hypothetical protein